MSKANQKVMRAKKIHLCNDSRTAIMSLLSLRRRYDMDDINNYINHNIMLLLIVTVPWDICFDVNCYDIDLPPIEGLNTKDCYLDDGNQLIENWPGYCLSTNITLFDKWLLEDNSYAPRVVKVGLWAAVEFNGYSMTEGIKDSTQLVEYLNNNYIYELKEFIYNEQHSIFLKAFILSHSIYYFEEGHDLLIDPWEFKKLWFSFHLYHPILFFNFVDDFEDRILQLAKYKNEPEFYYSSQSVAYEKKPYNSSQRAQEKLFDDFFRSIKINKADNIATKENNTTQVAYTLDKEFFKRMKSEAHKLRYMNQIDFMLVRKSIEFFKKPKSNNVKFPFHDRLITFLRSNGFDFEGDDPLGLRDIMYPKYLW